jgi:hypothetical protein
MNEFSRRRDALAGGALVIAGIILGAWAFQPPAPAHANQFAIGSASSLPAIPFTRTDLVLVKDKQGLYFVVGSNGLAAPIRYKDSDLRTVPSESLLMAP